ncbi:hypothetical protein LZ30DRAFT_719482 [Colletotrichum cereale]|nr:hypothetical protein LZ30DRAFT_719482 [Colletotrichum cereale]
MLRTTHSATTPTKHPVLLAGSLPFPDSQTVLSSLVRQVPYPSMDLLRAQPCLSVPSPPCPAVGPCRSSAF